MNTAQIFELVQQPSAADVALADMRAKFGRNGAASRWSRLPTRARSVICYAAGVSTTAAGQELDQLDLNNKRRSASPWATCWPPCGNSTGRCCTAASGTAPPAALKGQAVASWNRQNTKTSAEPSSTSRPAFWKAAER